MASDVQVKRSQSLYTRDFCAYQAEPEFYIVRARGSSGPAATFFGRSAHHNGRSIFLDDQLPARLICNDDTEAEALLHALQTEYNRITKCT